ncbi:hypothetical protein Tco_0575907 [Tanacetum coccineum]
MDRVDSALKEITAAMKQLDRSEAIEAINSFFHLRSHEPQESLTNIMLQFYKVASASNNWYGHIKVTLIPIGQLQQRPSRFRQKTTNNGGSSDVNSTPNESTQTESNVQSGTTNNEANSESNSTQNESKQSESNKQTETTYSINTATNFKSNSTETKSKEQNGITDSSNDGTTTYSNSTQNESTQIEIKLKKDSNQKSRAPL